MTIQDSNVTINVADFNRSISFYESIGFKLNNRWADHYAQLSAPGIIIGLHPATDKNAATGSGSLSIGFTTNNFEETKSDLEELNIAVTERNEEGGQFLNFADPDNTALYFIQPKW